MRRKQSYPTNHQPYIEHELYDRKLGTAAMITKGVISTVSFLIIFLLPGFVSSDTLPVSDRISEQNPILPTGLVVSGERLTGPDDQQAEPDDRMIYQQQVSVSAILNIKAPPFLAKGDGVTDDTAAIQAAINAATDPANSIAKILLMPDGQYVISSTLLVKNTRYFRLVGAGETNSTFVWRGDATAPALKILNASYSEFSNFEIAPSPGVFLKTGILLKSVPLGKQVSTHNIFRNLGITSLKDDLGVGIQIGSSDSFKKRNDYHMFLNCTVSNFVDTGIVIKSERATNLFFYNVILQAPAVGQQGVVATGGSYYWLNGGVNSLAEYGFAIRDPAGPITINLTNEEGAAGFVKAVASAGKRLDLTIENNRFAGINNSWFAGIPNVNMAPFVTIRGEGNVRINKNLFYSNMGATPTDERLFVFHRVGAGANDLYEYQYNRIYTTNPEQVFTTETLFAGALPSQLHENHYYLRSPDNAWTAGQYSSMHAYEPAGGSDHALLESYFDRMRKLSDSQFLFSSYASNSAGIIDIRKPPYNAKGDGVTDDTDAFQQALTDLMNSNTYLTGMLLIPAGDYVISHTLLDPAWTEPSMDFSLGLRIIGEGSGRSRLLWSGHTTGDSPTVAIDLAGVFQGEVRGIGLVLAPGSSADIGIRVRSGRFVASRNSLFDVIVDGEAGDLKTAIKVGDGPDANNDFHVFQNVVVSGYRNHGFHVANTQIYNLVFLDCEANGFEAGTGNTSQVGLQLESGTLSWFGGGGGNHTVTDMRLATHGNAPVIVSGASFEGSASLLNNGGPNQILVFMHLDRVSYTSAGSNNRFIELFSPGIHLIENSHFEINDGQTIFSFGDYSPYYSDEYKDAVRSLEAFDFIGNEIVSATVDWNTFYSGQGPTYSRDNQIIFP